MSRVEVEAGYASVAVPVPVRRVFTYRVGEDLELGPGTRVRVPFGNRKVDGTVVQWPAPPPDPGVELKTIDRVLSEAPRLPLALLELTRFVADYYLCSWGEAIETALPPRSAAAKPRIGLRRTAEADLAKLSSRAAAQRRLLESLPADGTPVAAERVVGIDSGVVRVLLGRGWIERTELPRFDAPAEPAPAEPPLVPTPDQVRVLAQLEGSIDGRTYAPFLLFGATGSGKTEVYLQAAARVLASGRSVLYLVPEIGLTPLLVERLARRFPDDVAVLHSGLGQRERRDNWWLVREGRRRVVVGTRSAVFAPLERLGLIVVDEEQDGSYKQAETPRYNGRDVAVVRARAENALLILGSATPSMESFHHARTGRYGLLRLSQRVHERSLAEVRLVDMREEYRRHGEVRLLSEALERALGSCLGRGEQALILRNRRGWAATTLCHQCGSRVECLHCSIALTWHRAERRLRCHYCGFAQRFPRRCSTCGSEEMKLLGEGTERLEDEIRRVFPVARVARMDRDTIRRRGAHEQLLRRFDRGEIDVMVGTQMIAKGHDFPRVTLVGVLSADQSLGIPDFRAGERTFQLLAQVAGRAGRHELPGQVVVQGFDPDHAVLRLAAAQDYEAFYDREIRYRSGLRYPPLTALIQIVVTDRDPLQAEVWADRVAAALREEAGGRLLLLGPGPAPVERLQGRHRRQILARTAGRRRLVEAVDRALAAVESEVPRRAILVDVDPYSVV